jgi:hypothetical protein
MIVEELSIEKRRAERKLRGVRKLQRECGFEESAERSFEETGRRKLRGERKKT